MTRRRGRPLGYKLNGESKDKIRLSRIGQSQNDDTKSKISESLKHYFRSKEGQNQLKVMSKEASKKLKYFYGTDEGKCYLEERSSIMKDLWDLKDAKKIKIRLSNNYKGCMKLMYKSKNKEN